MDRDWKNRNRGDRRRACWESPLELEGTWGARWKLSAVETPWNPPR